MNCLRRLRLAPLPPPRLPVSSFPRFVSSVPPPALASSLSPPRPPQKHKSKKAKKPTLPTTTPAEPLVLPLGLPRAGKEVDREADGRAIALSTAESYDTPALLKGLQALGLLGDVQGSAVNLVGEAIYIPRWSPPASNGAQAESGEIFIFESGTIVSWGLSLAGVESFLRKVVRGGPEGKTGEELSWVERGRYHQPETEVLEYWVNTDGETQMLGDAIHLTSPPSVVSNTDLLARLAFSSGMARTTKLAVYEEAFDEFAERSAGIPKLLESGSEAPVKKHDIVKAVGTLHGFRQKLNLEDENLLDEPEFLWEDEALHGYYSSVCNALEFDSRLRTLNQRVDYAFQLQSTLMDLLNTKISHRLEWIIIILIAFEISIVLLREGFAIRDERAAERKEKEKEAAAAQAVAV